MCIFICFSAFLAMKDYIIELIRQTIPIILYFNELESLKKKISMITDLKYCKKILSTIRLEISNIINQLKSYSLDLFYDHIHEIYEEVDANLIGIVENLSKMPNMTTSHQSKLMKQTFVDIFADFPEIISRLIDVFGKENKILSESFVQHAVVNSNVCIDVCMYILTCIQICIHFFLLFIYIAYILHDGVCWSQSY